MSKTKADIVSLATLKADVKSFSNLESNRFKFLIACDFISQTQKKDDKLIIQLATDADFIGKCCLLLGTANDVNDSYEKSLNDEKKAQQHIKGVIALALERCARTKQAVRKALLKPKKNLSAYVHAFQMDHIYTRVAILTLLKHAATVPDAINTLIKGGDQESPFFPLLARVLEREQARQVRKRDARRGKKAADAKQAAEQAVVITEVEEGEQEENQFDDDDAIHVALLTMGLAILTDFSLVSGAVVPLLHSTGLLQLAADVVMTATDESILLQACKLLINVGRLSKYEALMESFFQSGCGLVMALVTHNHPDIVKSGKVLLCMLPIGRDAQQGKARRAPTEQEQIEFAARREEFRMAKLTLAAKELKESTKGKISRQCSNSMCRNIEATAGKFSTCSRCRRACYCSKECQVLHWKSGHKTECKAP